MGEATLLATLLVGAGLFPAVYASRRRATRKIKNLRDVLEVAYLDSAEDLSAKDTSRLLAKAGLVAERALSESGAFSRVTSKVERSDWQVSPGEFVATSFVIGGLGLLLGMTGGSPPLAVILGAVGLVVPYLLISRSIERRRAKFESQFPDVLDLLGAALESGSSVTQGLELVVAEADDPAAGEFGRVLSAGRLGAPLVDGLTAMAERLGSRDLTWTVQAIVVQQRTGGRLAEVLRTVAGFMRAREEVRRELRALVAEGKMSAWILGALPFVIATVLLIANPDYLNPLFTTTAGMVMVLFTGVLMAIGFYVMSRIIKIEV